MFHNPLDGKVEFVDLSMECSYSKTANIKSKICHSEFLQVAKKKGKKELPKDTVLD